MPSLDTEGLVLEVDTQALRCGPGQRMAVHLKGCPLRCKWCHSPESREAKPEVVLYADRCANCGFCMRVCPNEGHDVGDAGHAVSRENCIFCNACVDECPNHALDMKGSKTSAQQIVERALSMKATFEQSGGGVTLTGGEVCLQPEFVVAVLAGCKEAGVHTAVETCGGCDWAVLERIADLADLILYDLKLIDDGQHRSWTGASNVRILENAKRLSGRNVVVRISLIPGVTDTKANLSELFAFMRDAGLPQAQLLPWDPSVGARYEWFGESCPVKGETQSTDRLGEIKELAWSFGVKASVG